MTEASMRRPLWRCECDGKLWQGVQKKDHEEGPYTLQVTPQCEWCLRMKLYSVVVCILPLSLSRIAKRVVELCKLPPWKILSMLNHPFSHNPHLSTRVHTICSIPSQGSMIYTIQCTRMRASVELCHSPPRRFSQPVVHNQESPLVSYASCV